MPTVKGNLMFVSSRAAQVSEVWVRAPRVRTHVEGVVTTGNDRFPVDGGEVELTAVPGPAVLALISQGRAVDTIPILVGDASTQTLRQVVSAAKIADDATQREIEKLAAQAVDLVDSSVANAKKAQDGATRAEKAASNASRSESGAASSAGAAKSSASSASSSASRAATSEQNAAKSASDAAGSADSAKADADRAAKIADATSWNGDKLTVNGKTSPSLTGPKGDPGSVENVSWDDIKGKPDDLGKSIDLLGKNVNLDTVTKTGVYHQATSANASTALNYPTGTAGLLEVHNPDAGMTYQRYTVYKSGDIYWRGLCQNSWGAWKRVSDSSHTHTVAQITGLDAALAAEKARTVGVTWTVPKESDVATKSSAAQTGDYIQVAQTHTIYRVTSGGVEVERYGTRTLQASTDSTSNRNPNQWMENDDPWAGVNWSRVSPPAGKWLIELINPHGFAADLYVEGSKVTTVTSGTAVYTTEFSTAAKSDVYVQIPGNNHYKPITLRFTPIN